MVIRAQSACPRFKVVEAALYLAKSAFIHGMTTYGKGFSFRVWLHDSVYQQGSSRNGPEKTPGCYFT